MPELYFFDLETRVDEVDRNMIPFYAVVQKVCSKCDSIPFEQTSEFFMPNPEIEHCDLSVAPMDCCGYRQYVFDAKGDNITSFLVEFMLRQDPNSVGIAHNGGRFDGIFLLKYLLEKIQIIPETVMNGNQILSLTIQEVNLKLIDSFSFLNFRLAKFPEALGFEDVSKGYHPYRFTDLEYNGTMISKDYYDVSEKEKQDANSSFNVWYNKKCEKTYCFRDEIYYYCKTDVDILRRGCVIFSKLIEEITGVIPFYDKSCITIASLALKIFRMNFLDKRVIGQIPANGYRKNVNQSLLALCWLSEVEVHLENDGYELDSNLSAFGERKILGRFVDGYCEETRTVYQFHGCFYHGCLSCFGSNDFNSVLNEKFYTLREKTRMFTLELQKNGYNVVRCGNASIY